MPLSDPTSPQSPSLIPPAQSSDPATSGMRSTSLIPQPVVAGVSDAETVSGQLRGILSQGSPLLESAKARSQEQATARGMQNSTMAVQAGEQALINTALPIAQQDASTNYGRTSANLNTVNQFGLQEAGTQGQLRVGDQNFQNQTQLQEQSIQGQLRVGTQNYQNQTGLQEQQIQGQLRVGEQQGQQQRELSAQNYQQQLGTLSAETQSRLQLLSAEGVQRLQEINAQNDANMRLQTADQNFQLLRQDRAAGQELTLENTRFQNQLAATVAEYGLRTNLSQTEQAQQIERMNVQHAQTLEQISAQAAATQRAEVGPRLQSQYLASVSDRMNASSQEIAQIYSTQGLSATQQQTAVANAYNRLQTDLAAISSYYQQSPFWDPNWGQNQQTQQPTVPGTPTPTGAPTITTPNTGGLIPGTSFPDTPYWNNRLNI